MCLAATTLHACGQNFPNNLLDSGDAAVLSAPVADFVRELQRLKLPPSRFQAVPATNGYDAQSHDAEMADLGAALRHAKVSPEESARIVEAHAINRDKLRKFMAELDSWQSHRLVFDDNGSFHEARNARPTLPHFAEVPGLPGEFADYFAGMVVWRNPDADKQPARETWERLLKRPAAERRFKSTWAAFMLGKSWENEDADKAIEYFQMTRDLAKQSFVDSIGLAAASLGLEARVELGRKHFQRAINLYLEQYASGDESAVVSLLWTAAEALAEGGEELASLADDANTRSVITAYLICGERGERFATSGSGSTNSTAAWLAAVEAANVKDVESAERLALAAYQEGEFAFAQRWVTRARNTPVAQWIQTKLFLRAGKIQQAAALLANVSSLLPTTDESATNSNEFADDLHMTRGESRSARAQMLGELGILHLTRREFTQALDALLRAGFWMDAAYIAERVLTTEELKDYVDRVWPVMLEEPKRDTENGHYDQGTSHVRVHRDIRYLLGRRLTRDLRGEIAREYFPREWQSKHDELMIALRDGWNEALPATQRAQGLFIGAVIARTNGMELFGTEVQPDWQIWGGDFQWGVTWQERATNQAKARTNVASSEEIRRASTQNADPEQRFHYRYQAAFLAWEAAKLMPNNSDETARVLCTAGSWLKERDPKTADIFYKALVRRCRKTAIGDQADRMRWFPEFDENENVIPLKKRESAQSPSVENAPAPIAGQPKLPPPDTAATSSMPDAGYEYTIGRGDSLAAIAQACCELKINVTALDILEANPGLDPTKLKIGQKIFIPIPKLPAIPTNTSQ